MNQNLVFLVSPSDPFLEKGGDRPPLGVAYISSWLKKHGKNTVMYDLNHDKEFDLINDISTNEPGYVCISVPTPGFNECLRLSKKIKNSDFQGKLVAGGHHVTALPNETPTLTHYNYVLRGDGEEGMLRIMNELPSEQIIVSKDIEPLDQIPFPDRDGLKLERYTMKLGGQKGTVMVTSRGCLYGCSYCGSSTIKKLRVHSPNYVVSEMKELIEKYGYEGIYIGDDIFTFHKQRVLDICSLMKSTLPTKPVVRATTRVDLIDKEMLNEMHSAGFDILSFGFESGDDEALKSINKAAGTKQSEECVKLCKEIGIKVKAFWIMGLPNETKESLQKTIDFAKKLDCEYNDIYPLVPYPSSSLWNDPNGIEIIKPENYNWEGYYQAGKDGKVQLKIKHPHLSEEDILEYISKFRKEVGSKGLTYD